MFELDPLRVSRQLEELAARVEVSDHALGRGRVTGNPFGRAHFPGLTLRQQLPKMHESDPLRPALLAWTDELMLRRLEAEFDAFEAELLFRGEHPPPAPFDSLVSPRQVFIRALAANADPLRQSEARACWEGLAGVGTELADHRLARWTRRLEIAEHVMDPPLTSALAISVESAEGELAEEPSESVDLFTALAEQLLSETDDAAEAGIEPGWPGFVRALLAVDVGGNWPARLGPDTVLEMLGGRSWVANLNFGPIRLPERLAPASFFRAALSFGREVRRSSARTDLPFVVVHAPGGFDGEELGRRLALWMTTVAFGRRHLGLSRSSLELSQRHLRTALVAEIRLSAVRVLLASEASKPGGDVAGRYASTMEQLCAGVAGRPLALFGVARHERVRFAALLSAAVSEHEMRERFDEDWLDNPRAREFLRDEATGVATVEIQAARLRAGAELLTKRVRP